MNNPTEDWSAPPLADLSLNWVIRLASPKPVMQLSTHGQLGVLGHVALHEQRAALRVQPGPEQLRGRDPGPAAQQGRVVPHRDRVQVHHAVERVVGLLQRHPLLDGAEVVAQVERVGGGLDAGEHARLMHAGESMNQRRLDATRLDPAQLGSVMRARQ